MAQNLVMWDYIATAPTIVIVLTLGGLAFIGGFFFLVGRVLWKLGSKLGR